MANRGQFDATLQQWVKTSAAKTTPFVLALIDVDQFKTINDTHGHPAGDRALVTVAETLVRSVRPCDLVARYGGDEFALLLANMTLDQAETRMPQIVSAIARSEPEGTPALRLTISCGSAQYARADTADTLIQRADEALYGAKQQGRNCAVAKRGPLRALSFLPAEVRRGV